MSEQAWRLVKETPQVTGFIGNQAPQEIPLSSIERLRPRIA
jgi:transcription termination/antitermination protein NusG